MAFFANYGITKRDRTRTAKSTENYNSIYMSYEDALSHLHLESLRDRRELLTKSFYRSVLKQDNKLNDLIPTVVNHTYSLRNPRNIPMFKSRTNRFKNSTIPYSVQKWDTVP